MTDNESPQKETLENKKKRLVFRAWHRGTREMDLILGSFANTHIEKFDDQELAHFDELLHNPDPDLYDWITGRADVPKEHASPVMQKLLDHHYAENRKSGSDDR